MKKQLLPGQPHMQEHYKAGSHEALSKYMMNWKFLEAANRFIMSKWKLIDLIAFCSKNVGLCKWRENCGCCMSFTLSGSSVVNL